MQNLFCYLLVDPVQVNEVSSTTIDLADIPPIPTINSIREEPYEPVETYLYDEQGILIHYEIRWVR